MSTLEWIAFALNVLCVALIVIEVDINWPIGVLASIALAAFFWQTKLYAQVGLQTFYVAEGIFGWYKWTRRDRSTGSKLLRIGKTKRATAIWLTVVTAMGTAALYPLLLLTGDPAPFWDSLITVASLAAEYMLCLKLFEAWPVYLATDIVSLFVLAFLQYWITFGTYLAFVFLCILGTLEWLRRLRKNSATASSGASSIPSTEAINT